MQSCERVVFISTISAELVDMAETIQQFREDGIAYHVLGEVTGLLLYGDSYIFHCFESRHGDMAKLKQDMLTYRYHHNQRLIYDKTNVEPRFNSWSMVYVLTERPIQDFLKKHHWTRFNPYLLEGELLDEFMEVIYSYSDINQMPLMQTNGQSIASQQIDKVKRFYQYKLVYVFIVLGLALITGLIAYGLDYFKLGLNDIKQ